MSLVNRLKEGTVLYSGAMGTELQALGLGSGACAEEWNVTHPDLVKQVLRSFIDAGSQVIQTNTFGANGPVLETHGLAGKEDEFNSAGAELALSCAEGTGVLVAGSVGPSGLYFEPAGHLNFEAAVEIFTVQLKSLKKAGITLVNFETFMDINEMRAAIMAAKHLGGLEIISTMTFRGDRTMNGTSADACAVSMTCLGADIIGANCSGGPESLEKPLALMARVSEAPLCAKPNAGKPEVKDGKTVYSLDAQSFAQQMKGLVAEGASLVGGCCGTTPAYISALGTELKNVHPGRAKAETGPFIASPLESLSLDNPNLDYAIMEFPEIDSQMEEDDFMSVSDILPVDIEDRDICVLDFRGLGLDFSVEKLVTAVTLFVKKPVIVKGGSNDLVELFLRYYPGRAGLVKRKSLPDKLFGAVLVDSSYRPVS